MSSLDIEILDIVDEGDEVIGTETREVIHQNGLRHREVHLWVFDKEKNIYFQKSGMNKPSAGLLDATAGGHLNSGETYEAAAIRETQEEIGVTFSLQDIVLLDKFSGFSEYQNTTKTNNFIRAVFICKSPISEERIIKQGDSDSLGIKKFNLDFLLNLNEEEKKIFHKFVPTHELPKVLDYVKKF